MSSVNLSEIGPGVFGYFQPDGAWGLSNAGLVVGRASTLLVDTLFDYALTKTMLDTMSRACERAKQIDIVVNTHANGDHCYGNALLKSSRIVSSERTRHEMLEMAPKKMAALMSAAKVITGLGPLRAPMRWLLRSLGLKLAADLVQAAPLALRAFRRFEFRGIELRLPDETFESELQLELGDRKVNLIKVGPAHTEGDVIAHLPDARVVFAGDILFSGLHPLAWAGSISSYVAACERIIALEPDVVVPGHGPVTNCAGVREHIEYFRALLDEVRTFVQNDVLEIEAVRQLLRRGFGSLKLPERLVVNVNAAYREVRGHAEPNDMIALFAKMAALETS